MRSGDAEELIRLSAKYLQEAGVNHEFQKEANKVLDRDQKLTVLANLIDILLADGRAEDEEQELFFSFVNAFGISEDEIGPYIDIISVKMI